MQCLLTVLDIELTLRSLGSEPAPTESDLRQHIKPLSTFHMVLRARYIISTRIFRKIAYPCARKASKGIFISLANLKILHNILFNAPANARANVKRKP